MAKPSPASAPKIVQFVNLWTMWDYPTAKREWSLDRKFAAIKEAGFDAFGFMLEKEHARLAAKHGLRIVGAISAAKTSEFRPLIEQCRDNGAERINCQLGDHDTSTEEAIRLAVRVIEEGERAGVPVDVEVHRDTCTETPEKTYALAYGFKKATGRILPMTWDFSHLSCVKHLAPPYYERLLVDKKLIQHSRHFHFRPFNGHHCQIPVTDGNGRLSTELKQWLPFLEKTLELIATGSNDGRDIYVCPEMGPIRGGYNFAQLPNSFEDAKVLRPIIDRAWKKALASRASA